MPANWTQPATWSVNQLVTADDLNTHLRDNLEFLKSPPTGSYLANEATDYSTTSTTFVDVDSAKFAYTLDTEGGDIMIGWFGSVRLSQVDRYFYFDVLVNTLGRVGGDDGLIVCRNPSVTINNRTIAVSFVFLLRSVPAGTHTFKLQWKVDGASATLYSGAATSLLDVHPQFWVREVS